MIKDKLLWPFKKISWRLVVGLLIIVIFLSLARFLPLNDWLDTFNNWVKDLGFIGYILFIAVYALASVLFINPGCGFCFWCNWWSYRRFLWLDPRCGPCIPRRTLPGPR
jgi:uncharacterized membrane protein YdjX (TVP38/TMEM64 family)